MCVSWRGTLCGAADALKLPAPGDAPIVGTRLEIAGQLPFDWQGDDIVSCFRFCHRRDFGSCQEPRDDHTSDVYEISDPNARQYVMSAGALRTFEALPIVWEVAACNAADECFWSAPAGYRMPALAGSYAQMMPVFHADKCMNCHGFAGDNTTHRRHVGRGRLQPGDSVTDAANCAASGCHGNGQFPAGWRAPSQYRDFTTHSCFEITHLLLNDNPGFMRNHLTTDALVLWAVDRIPGLTRAAWLALVDNWYGTGMRCQRDGSPEYLNGQ